MSKVIINGNDFKIAAIGKKGSWGTIVRQACFRRGYQNVTQIFEDIDKVPTFQEYDVVFIDDESKSGMLGTELLDELKAQGKLPYTTAAILVGGDIKQHKQNYDTGLQVCEFLELPLSEQQVMSHLEKVLLASRDFKTTLTFIESGNYPFAFKALKKISKQDLTEVTAPIYYRLFINLSVSLGRYEDVIKLCQSKQFKAQKWAVWPQLKACYELGDWAQFRLLCEDERFSALPSGASKLFWQLRDLIQEQDYQSIIELVEAFPKHKLSSALVRLTYSLLVFQSNGLTLKALFERALSLKKKTASLSVPCFWLCAIYISINTSLPIIKSCRRKYCIC
jgi:CheY-like chemotaxis protein